MSADNWAVCPRCEDQRRERATELSTAAFNAYGKVSEAEYHRLRDEAQKTEESVPERTLREDYDIGTDEGGTFSVDYRSHCGECGYSFDHKIALSDDEIDALNAAKPPNPIEAAARKLAAGRGRSRKSSHHRLTTRV